MLIFLVPERAQNRLMDAESFDFASVLVPADDAADMALDIVALEAPQGRNREREAKLQTMLMRSGKICKRQQREIEELKAQLDGAKSAQLCKRREPRRREKSKRG